MTYRRQALFALVAVLAVAQILVAQRNQQDQAETASTAKALPFDPHDISGIWRNPGGFDPILGTNRPPMTAWGKEQWSKTRASARNTPLAFGFYQDQKDWNDPLFQCANGTAYGATFGRTDASCRDLKQSRVGTDMRPPIGKATLLSLNRPVTMSEPGSIPTAPSTVTRCVLRSASGAWITTIWKSA